MRPEAWRESCTCPGAGPARRRLDEAGAEFPDFGEKREQARLRSRARRDAFESARAAAADKDRDEIREIYLAELSARNLPAPSGDILDAVAERISGNPFPAARVAVESVTQMGKALREISRFFRSLPPVVRDRNVGIHHVAALVSLGEGGLAVEVAAAIDQEGFRLMRRERQANHLVEVARGYGQRGMRDQAVEKLLEAEALAPREVACRPIARKTIENLVKRSRSQPSASLTALAGRAGVTA